MENRIGCFVFLFISLLIYLSLLTEIPFIGYFIVLIIVIPILINIYSKINSSSDSYKEIPRLDIDKKHSSILQKNEKKPLRIEERIIFHNNVLINDNRSGFFKILIIILISIILITFITRKRVGAICNDGTLSYSTNSGTCSHHDGVRSWKHEYWWD